MSIGEKIAAKVPDEVITYFCEHPRALCAMTGVLVVASTALLLTASELDTLANLYRKAHLGEMQRAASEALGG